MKYLKITNKGEVEQEAFSLLGASSKGEDESKIGFFGSGNKYAFALFLREGIGFKVFSGKKEVTFRTKRVDFRGESFEQIVINRKSTSLTTRLGPEWKTWYALREVISNAIDEGDWNMDILESDDELEGEEGKTIIFLEATHELEEILENFENYFMFELPEGTVSSLDVDIIPPSSDGIFNVYRKGICVNPGIETDSAFRYNLENIDINESRVIDSRPMMYMNIAKAFAACEDEDVVRKIIATHSGFEESIDWEWSVVKFSSTWRKVLGNKPLIPEGALSFIGLEDAGYYTTIQNSLYTQLQKCIPDLNYIVGGTRIYKEVEPTEKQFEIFNAAKLRLENLGVRIATPVSFVEVPEEEEGLLGWYDSKMERIFLVNDYLIEPVEEVMQTLFEENFHAAGYSDNSRSFEKHLMVELLNEKEKLARVRNALSC